MVQLLLLLVMMVVAMLCRACVWFHREVGGHYERTGPGEQ
jgi:hypothetical protein